MIFTAHLDESGTHGGSPITLMSSVLGSARQWQNFEKEYAKLRRRYGFSVFHAKEYRDTDGEFKNWSRVTKHQFALEFFAIVDDKLSGGVVAFLKNEDYDAYYLRGDKPRKTRLDTKYAICFRAVLSMLVAQMAKRQRPGKNLNPLHLVLERGARNAGDAVRIFKWIKQRARPQNRDLFGTLTFAGKEDCPALATADFFAYSANFYEVDALKPVENRRLSAETHELKSDIWRIEIGTKELRSLKEKILISDAARFVRTTQRIIPNSLTSLE